MISYYLHKIRLRILNKLLVFKGNFSSIKNIAFLRKSGGFSKKIVFCFWDSRIVHLGDQLFYQPVIEHLSKKYNVEIVTYGAMEEYFSSFNYKTLTKNDFNFNIKDALLITNGDMLWEVKKAFPSENNLMSVNYNNSSGEKRIVENISEVVGDALNRMGESINMEEGSFCPDIPVKLLERYKDDSFFDIFNEGNFIIFNNYIASKFHGANKRRKKVLERIAMKKREEGFKIVHIGSEKDKKDDKRNYDFVDYDLRGRTKPLDLFKIFSLENVKGVISFDTFVMHVASILKKDLYIVIRRWATKEKMEKIEKTFVPMAACLEGTEKFIYKEL